MIIVFDIGGTQMRLAGSEDGKTLTESVAISTPQDPQVAVEQFNELANDVTEEKNIDIIAGGIAGPLNKDHTALVASPNLAEWVDFPLKDELQKQCGADEVYIENDTALVGLGEAHAGAGTTDGVIAYITISTGAGGTRIVDGAIDRNAHGFEPGHQIINLTELDAAGTAEDHIEGQVPGHWEYYVSGPNMERRYGSHPRDIEDPQKWAELEHELVAGLNNITVLWSPDMIVLGGAMITKKTGIVVERVEEALSDMLAIFSDAPAVKKAALGDKGGLHGALTYIRQQS